MTFSPHTKSALSGALGASLALVLLVGLLGASGRGHRDRHEARERPGFPHEVLRRLEAIDSQLRALRTELDALAPVVDQVQADVTTLAQAPGGPAGPPEVFGLQICLKAGLAGEVGLSGEQTLKLEGQGRVGAEAYGNGVMAHIRAIPGARIGGGVKGDAAGELTACFDLRALAQRIRAGTLPFAMPPRQQQAVLRMADTDEAVLAGKLLDFAALTNLDPTSVQEALDQIPQLATDVNPIRMAEPGNAVTTLAQSVPMSFQARARIQDVNATFDTFQQQSGQLCAASLPPGLARMVDPVCTAAANEPLKGAIQTTATRVNDVQSRVIWIQEKLRNIPRQVRDAMCAVLPVC